MSNRVLLIKAVESPLEIDPAVLEERESMQIDFGSGIFGEPATDIVVTGEELVNHFKTMTEEAYNALPVKDPSTYYFLYEDEGD
ncbi:MAG: hypothetical protein II604_04645 [Bacteroidales bacterium]|nr:hypothetical protein [Bacteroidales bacterium]